MKVKLLDKKFEVAFHSWLWNFIFKILFIFQIYIIFIIFSNNKI